MMEAHFQETATKYFTDPIAEAVKNGLTPESTEKIKIKLSIEKCQINTIYQIVLKSVDNSFTNFPTEEKVAKSNDSTVEFSSYLTCDYYFEELQKIQILIYLTLNSQKNYEKVSFQRNTKLSSIVCEKGGIYKRKIAEDEKSSANFKEILVLTVEKFNPEQLFVNFSFKCKKDKNIKYSEKANKTRFLIKNNETNIYLSEITNDKGTFNDILIPNELLTPIFSILFFNIDRILTNVISLNVKRFIENSRKKKNNEFLQVPVLNKKNDIITIINNSKLATKYSLFEFIKAGIRLNTIIAIDLSTKKLGPQFIKVIESFGTIISLYSCINSKIPVFKVYGFGAKIKNNDITDNEYFNLNLEKNPDISELKAVIKKYKEFYKNNVKNIDYNNDNNLSPLINHVADEITIKYEPLEYNILFILTSNKSKDIKQNIDSLISGSYIPLSVVIIGVGEEKKFEEMKVINNLPQSSSKGMDKLRNNGQFIYVDQNETITSKKYLRELAKQIVEYYNLNNSSPEKIKQNNIKNIKESFNMYQSFAKFQFSTMGSVNDSLNIFNSNINEDGKNNNQKKSIKNVTILPYGLDIIEEEDEKDKTYINDENPNSIFISSNPYSEDSINDINFDHFTMNQSIKIDEDNKIEKFINTPYYANSILSVSVQKDEDEKEVKPINASV